MSKRFTTEATEDMDGIVAEDIQGRIGLVLTTAADFNW
jgi:hypothetical protein